MKENKDLDLDRVLKFLPYFEADDFRYVYGERGMICTYGEDVTSFVAFLQETDFLLPFDFNDEKWSQQAEDYTRNPELIKEAGLEDLRKLMTTYVEKDKDIFGFMVSVVRGEQVLQILQRLRVLRDNGDR
jgi:hypothetical protein